MRVERARSDSTNTTSLQVPSIHDLLPFLTLLINWKHWSVDLLVLSRYLRRPSARSRCFNCHLPWLLLFTCLFVLWRCSWRSRHNECGSRDLWRLDACSGLKSGPNLSHYSDKTRSCYDVIIYLLLVYRSATTSICFRCESHQRLLQRQRAKSLLWRCKCWPQVCIPLPCSSFL